MTKTDPVNIALVVLVFMNTLAVLQFQSLAWASPLGTSKVSTMEIARDRIADAVGLGGTFTRGDHQFLSAR